jgi:hypothetical protein
VREESSVSNGLTDQWTDDLLVYYKEIYTGLHKIIDLNMEGILVELLLPPQISSTHTHNSHFPT